MTARAQLDRAMSEEDLLSTIVEAALLLGWRVHHDRRSDKAQQMGNAGFPDLVIAKGGYVLFLECKSETGRLTQDQWAWAKELDLGGDPTKEHRVVRPSDLDAVLGRLAYGPGVRL
jgi:hypothetical protein